jgi:hypothetical protein
LPDLPRRVDADRVEARRRNVGQLGGLDHQVTHLLGDLPEGSDRLRGLVQIEPEVLRGVEQDRGQILDGRRPFGRRMDQRVEVLGHPARRRGTTEPAVLTHRGVPLTCRQRLAQSLPQGSACGGVYTNGTPR